jgi:hypothetical protein
LAYAATRPARSLGTVLETGSRELVELVDRALSFEKGARWPDAAEMKAALLKVWEAESEEDLAEARLDTHAMPEASRREEAPWPQTPTDLADQSTVVSTEVLRGLPTRTIAGTVATGANRRTEGVENRERRRWFMIAATGLVLTMAGIVASASIRKGGHPTSGTGSSSASGETGSRCASNAECVRARGGAAWRCHGTRRTCVPIETPSCVAHAEEGALERDDTVWIGGLFPTTGDTGRIFFSEHGAALLARAEIAHALAGVTSLAAASHAPPIGLVVCDEMTDVIASARHLVDDVEVPAVIGFKAPETATATIPSIFLPGHVLSVITISQMPGLTRIPQPRDEPRLVWRTTLDGAEMAAPLASLIADVLESRVHNTRPGGGPMRIAVVRPSDVTLDFSDVLFGDIRFNGKSVLENRDSFRQFVFDLDDDATAQAVVAPLAAFAPDILVYRGNAFVTKILSPAEAQGGANFRPYFLTDNGFSPDVATFVGASAERRHRFFGVTNVSNRLPNAELVLRFGVAYPGEPISLTNSPQPSYDAFYLVAYAILSLGNQPVTGPAIARAFSRLQPPGDRYDVGPAHIFDVFSALRDGRKVDLNGAIGDLDLDPETGEAPIDLSILCLGVDERGMASDSIESGLVYQAATRRLTGTLRCP